MEKNTNKRVPYDPKNLSELDESLFYGRSLLGNLQTEPLSSKQGSNANQPEKKESEEELVVQKPKSRWEKFVINPKNRYKIYFDNFILMLVIYSTITTAYYVAFAEDANGFLKYFDYCVEFTFAIDICLKMITCYEDDETGAMVTDHWKIFKHYIFSWTFVIDMISTFPTYLVTSEGEFTKILRLIRLKKASKLFASSKFEALVECIMKIKLGSDASNNYHELMRTKYISRYIYKIIRLILFALLLTYFCACAWYGLARVNLGNYHLTFLDHPNVAPKKGISRLIVCCYFTLTMLATVGYGDIVPQNNGEKIMGILLMIVGIAFFSYIMSNFNDVLINYDKKMGIVDQGSDLQVWLTSLSKFTSQKPLPRSLVKKIDQHFRFYWKNDRLSSITKDDHFLKLLPKDIRFDLITYLFDEVFQMFRGFFLKKEFEDSQFFYDVAFYLLPRKAEANEKILEQGDDVNEIYFILDGEVKLSFKSDSGDVCRYFGKDYYFGDYYVFFEKPAEFDYTATTPVNMLVLPKSKMLELASKYKTIYDKMLSNSIKNSMYTAKAMQGSYQALAEKKANHFGETKTMPHDVVMEKYTLFVKTEAKRKREERIKSKNQEIFNSEADAKSPAIQAKNAEVSTKNFKQNLEDLDIIARKIDKLKTSLEQSLS